MLSQEIRKAFLTFFNEKGHRVVSSSPLVPGNDKTLLFTNAGMVQFKDVFLGLDKRDYRRAVTSQKCVRAGGKHNDLENVGYTARHHTFFEMLGNFSFGDYFKEQAIEFAWELITERFKLPKEKLWITVFEEDDEAFDIWHQKIGVPKDRISRIGAKDNFWQMGDTGPCGPCSEIFYDHGEHVWGGPPGTPEEDGDRFIEIWNLVFMQYDRQPDGELIPLPKPSVDTGMGLERMAAILQGVHSNYEIDMFVALINAAAKATGTNDVSESSLKVIADHIRSTAFLLLDGVIPSNEGRGYVLRRIIRRAVRHGYKLGKKSAFLYQLVEDLCIQMGEAYPDLVKEKSRIAKQIKNEEEKFQKTIEDGMVLLEADLSAMKGETISGETLFKLYDTYGFPVDLTADIARERKLLVDMDGYEKAMATQVKRSQAKSGFKGSALLKVQSETMFVGYEQVACQSTVLALFVDGMPVEDIDANLLSDNQQVIVVTDKTCFYGESGGQVGDTGMVLANGVKFEVVDTQKQGNSILHIGDLNSGKLAVKDRVDMLVNKDRRHLISKNHSATHLVHSAIHKVLGKQATQKGSLVNPQRLRFDFSHDSSVTTDELLEIERLANNDVMSNYCVDTKLMTIDEAKAKGAMALFGEKYGDTVRVVTIGDDSIELCGGIHVKQSGEIGQIAIVTESGVASGVRRIEALTGAAAISYRQQQAGTVTKLASLLKVSASDLDKKISQMIEAQKESAKEIKQLKNKILLGGVGAESEHKTTMAGRFKVLTAQIDGLDAEALRNFADQQKDKHNADIVVVASIVDDKVKLVVSVNKAETKTLHAGQIIAKLAKAVDGKGGGRPDFAQAGGNNPSNISQVFDLLNQILQEKA